VGGLSRFVHGLGGRFEAFALARRRPPPLDAHDRARGLRRLELGAASIRVRDVGRGPRTIVFIPDPPNTIEHYDELFERLRGDARLLCFEIPGFGLSYPRTARFSCAPDEYAGVFAEVLERTDARDAIVVSSCLAAYVAMIVARRRPELISRLVLCQTPAPEYMVRWARRFDPAGLLGVPVLGQAIMFAVHSAATRFWYPAALPYGADAAPFLAPAAAAQRLGGPYALASGIQSLHRLDAHALDDVRQPLTVVWGHADRTHAGTDPRSLRRYVPHARFESFERCGHFPDLEDPRRFARLVLDP
jgi:pimeloyl-ACP methyl ester carboxylesterase